MADVWQGYASEVTAPPATDVWSGVASPLKQQNLAQTNALQAATDKAANTATFGLGSVASGLGAMAANPINALMGTQSLNLGGAYNQGRQDYTNTSQAEDVQHPTASMLGDVAGIAGSMPLAPKGAIDLLANAPDWLANKYAVRGLAGAGAGGAVGFGTTPGDILDQLKGAGYGALTGAAAGEAIPAAMDAGGYLATPLINAIRNKLSTPEELAENKLGQMFSRDNLEPSDVLQKMMSSGDSSTLLDSAGKNTKSFARTLAGQPGEGQEIISNALQDRQQEQIPQASAMLRDNMGGNASLYDTVDNIIKQQQEKSAPLYQEAFKQNQNVSSPAIDNILNTPAGKKALGDARTMMLNDQTSLGVTDPELTEQMNDAGIEGKAGSGLKLQTLDYVKRALDDQIGPLLQSGEKAKAGIIIGLKNKLLNEMDNADVTSAAGPNSVKPDGGLYAQARGVFSDAEQSKKAVEMGRDIISGDSELGARQFSSLSDSNKQLARVGAQHELMNTISNTPDGADVVKRIFGNSDKRSKLQALFPDQTSFQNFSDSMDNLSQQYKNNQFVLGGSQTAEKLANANEDFPLTKSGIAAKLMGNIAQRFSDMTPEAKAIAAQKLVSPDQGMNQQTLMSIAMRMKQNADNGWSGILSSQAGRSGQQQ